MKNITQIRKKYAKLSHKALFWLYSRNIPKNTFERNALLDEIALRRLVDIQELNRKSKRATVHNVSLNSSGRLVDMSDENFPMSRVAEKYSLMKFGSHNEIQLLAKELANTFIARLENPEDNLRNIFEKAKDNEEHVVLISPGSRNVESAQNSMVDIAMNHINIWLGLKRLPTIVQLKLLRLGKSRANYSELSEENRILCSNTKTILPGNELYRHGVHIFFVDDARITGTAANKIEQNAIKNGALSFFSLYYLIVDPKVALKNPDIENRLNRTLIRGNLDDWVLYILNQEKFRPVQRLMRLLLKEENQQDLKHFLKKVINDSLIKLYVASMGNDFYNDNRYSESINILIKELFLRKLINKQGILI